MSKVIPLRPTPTDGRGGLLGLPACVVTNCGRCGRTCDDANGWISRDFGCKTCAPDNETVMLATCEMRDTIERMRPLVDAAIAWDDARGNPLATAVGEDEDRLRDLVRAIATYEAWLRSTSAPRGPDE